MATKQQEMVPTGVAGPRVIRDPSGLPSGTQTVEPTSPDTQMFGSVLIKNSTPATEVRVWFDNEANTSGQYLSLGTAFGKTQYTFNDMAILRFWISGTGADVQMLVEERARKDLVPLTS